MKDSTIEYLAYQIKQAKEQGLPKPIVFLGAGASKTGGIPLAPEIAEDIIRTFPQNPKVAGLPAEKRTYANLMECLTPYERNSLLKGYIDQAKINVTHIYLAQLLKNGYVDYVLTVNFDNLVLRALALYNEFPPTYDMAILKDLTTTNFKEKSVIYLHGQHHGLWLLNTPEEMGKVRELITPILNKITNQRQWIFLGYSGGDPIFDHVVKLGRFDNDLHWVCFLDNDPQENVCKALLDKANTNSFVIKGYDSDSFMLKLNEELDLEQPEIIDKPFTSLKNSLKNIVDIDAHVHFKGVRERLEIVKKQVDSSIAQFEEGNFQINELLVKETELDRFKRKIIGELIREDFEVEKISTILDEASKFNPAEINSLLSSLYLSWGNKIFDQGLATNDRACYLRSIEKFEEAAKLNPKNDSVFYNWGNALIKLAKLTDDEALYHKCIEMYENATRMNSDSAPTFNNWGNALANLAQLKTDSTLYVESFEKYARAAELKPQDPSTYHNWGSALIGLAKLTGDKELFKEAVEKCWRSIELGGKHYNLSCAYALTGDKTNALKYLEISIKNRDYTIAFINNDEDWNSFRNDPDFNELLEKYSELSS